jgi:hypothetical protein
MTARQEHLDELFGSWAVAVERMEAEEADLIERDAARRLDDAGRERLRSVQGRLADFYEVKP